jgi:ectoine hydroxylase-related dioxygenase (phytanoyl-CoA dioxygenase family)
MLFTGLLQHAAMPNKSTESRTGLLLQYLPKCMSARAGGMSHASDCTADVKPMEDMERIVRPDIIAAATPKLRQVC